MKYNIYTPLAIYNMINIISNKSNNQMEDKILNKMVLTKSYEFFYTFSKFAIAMKLITHIIVT